MFMLLADKGTHTPNYIHITLESAMTEAHRLHLKLKSNIKVLEVIAEINFEQVPVTKTETVVKFHGRKDQQQELPF